MTRAALDIDIDMSTPTGELMATVVSAMAQIRTAAHRPTNTRRTRGTARGRGQARAPKGGPGRHRRPRGQRAAGGGLHPGHRPGAQRRRHPHGARRTLVPLDRAARAVLRGTRARRRVGPALLLDRASASLQAAGHVPRLPASCAERGQGDARAVKARDEGAGAGKLPAVHRGEQPPDLLGGLA